MNKQDRQGVRTPAQLEEKYNFGKSFAEIMGIATDAQTDAKDAKESSAHSESEVLRLDEEIRTTVKKVDNSNEEITQEINTRYSELSQTANGIEISITEVRESVEGKADFDTVTALTENFHMDADGLTIGNTAKGMGIRVNEEQVAFLGQGDPTTVIRPNDMHTTNLTVETRLDLGGFSFIPRTNQNMSLRWTGGNT